MNNKCTRAQVDMAISSFVRSGKPFFLPFLTPFSPKLSIDLWSIECKDFIHRCHKKKRQTESHKKKIELTKKLLCANQLNHFDSQMLYKFGLLCDFLIDLRLDIWISGYEFEFTLIKA